MEMIEHTVYQIAVRVTDAQNMDMARANGVEAKARMMIFDTIR